MAGQPWLPIKAACLCLQDGLFQNYEGKKKRKERGCFGSGKLLSWEQKGKVETNNLETTSAERHF